MSLSLEEFARMQETMMSLKSQAFESAEKAKRFETQLKEALKNADKWEKEASKANKALEKSKKAKEVQIMMEQQELEKHEYEKQRDALLKNLAELNTANEHLQREVDTLKGSTGSSDGHSSSTAANGSGASPAEVEAWKTKVHQLEESLNSLRKEHETHVAQLKESAHKAQEEVKQWQAKYLAAVEGKSHEGASDAQDASADPAALQAKVSSLQSLNKELVGMKEKAEEHSASLAKEVAALEERVEKIRQENEKLKKDAEGSDSAQRDKLAKLEADLKQAEEKAKKKQASFLTLQEEMDAKLKLLDEKDKAVLELKANVKDLEAKLHKAQEDHKSHQDDKTSSTQMIEQTKKEVTDAKSASAAAEKKLELFKMESAEKIYAQGQQIQQLESKVQQLEARVEQLTKENDALSLARKLQDEAHHKDILAERAKTAEAQKIAESRKENMDKLAMDAQLVGEKHQEELHALEKKKEDKILALQNAWAAEKEELKQKNAGLRQKIEDLNQRSELATKLEKQLADTNGVLAAVREEKAKVEKELADLREHIAQEIKTYVDKASESEAKALQMQATLAEEQENLALSRKKDAVVLKDLKRELLKEQKKREKLETELQDIRMKGEFLHGSHDTSSLGGDVQSKKGHRRTASGASGLSKLLSGSRESLSSLNSVGTTGGASSTIVSEDEAQLIHRMTAMQTERAALKERIHALEEQNKEFQAELKEKSAVISHFLTGNVASSPLKTSSTAAGPFKKPLPPQKLDPVGLYESNKRMQTIMEETIMKNIQLQAMVDALSKAGSAPPSSNASATTANPPTSAPAHISEEDMQTKL